MEEFKKELDALLTKYPDLPEMTLTVRPRIVITPVVKYPPLPYVMSGTANILNIPDTSKDLVDATDMPSALERTITPAKLREMNKSIKTE